jgi:hypothetical protein
LKKLVLHVKKIYFDLIKSGAKSYEYRLITPYWTKRIFKRSYDVIEIHCGYPKQGDTSKIITRKWSGYYMALIHHDHFGKDRVKVFAIDVRYHCGK